MAKRAWLLLPAVVVLVVATLPAALVAPRLGLPNGVTQIRGTVWSGSAEWRQAGWQPLALSWRWRGGRDWHWQASGGQTALAGRWRVGPKPVLPQVSGRLELERLDLVHWLGVARPVGSLQLDLADVVFAPGAAPRAHGSARWRQAGLAGAIQESLGEIEIDIEQAADGLKLRVRSLHPAAVQVRGAVALTGARYEADLWLRAASGRPRLIAALAEVGELQPDGQVRLRVSGRTGL
ncbi:MAG: type II secretion system protein N [Wenzhouxiangella sp.]